MADSARILNPGKTVLLPNLSAGCALADSITAESLLEWSSRYPHCLYMNMINLDALRRALMEGVFPVEVDSDDALGARRALERMMAVPRDV